MLEFMTQTSHLPASKQDLKSERARTIICNATVECLADRGYAETTISRVVEHAGVSKGALQHHFPSKEDLMASTAAYLLEVPLRLNPDSTRSGIAGDVRGYLRLIWTTLINTRAYLALLEILVAARTDKVLHKRIANQLKASINGIDDHFMQLYGNLSEAEHDDLKVLMVANRCLMRGLLIEQQYGLSKTAQQQVIERWLDLIVPILEKIQQH